MRAVDQLRRGRAERQLDPPEADILLRGVDHAGCLVDADPLELGQDTGLLARHPRRTVRQGELAGQVQVRDSGVAHALGRHDETSGRDGRRAFLGDHDVRRPAPRLVDGQAVGGVLGVDTLAVRLEQVGLVGCGDLGERHVRGGTVRVDREESQGVVVAVGDHRDVDALTAYLQTVGDVDVVVAAGDCVCLWRRRCGQRLELLSVEVVDAKPALLGSDDDDRVGRVVRVDPDGRVVAGGVATVVVVVQDRCLVVGRHADGFGRPTVWRDRRGRCAGQQDEEDRERERGRAGHGGQPGQVGTPPGERRVKGRRRARDQPAQRSGLVVLTRSHASTAAAS